jgi:hypothetical protein
MTPAEIKARRVVALRLFYALRAHYPGKHVSLSIPPRDVADDEHDDPTLPKTAGSMTPTARRSPASIARRSRADVARRGRQGQHDNNA